MTFNLQHDIALSIELCKEAVKPVFSWEFYEISKNTFSYRTPPVAASVL